MQPPLSRTARRLISGIVSSKFQIIDEIVEPSDTPEVPPPATPSLLARLEYEKKHGLQGHTEDITDLDVPTKWGETQTPAEIATKRSQLEGLFPPKEGFRVTEGYSYALDGYTPEVMKDKAELAERVGLLPRHGMFSAWSQEQMDEAEKASFSMTPEGALAFRADVERVQNIVGLTKKEAVHWVEAGNPTTPAEFARERDIQELKEDITNSPYKGALRDGIAGDMEKVVTLLKQEGLINAAGDSSDPEHLAARRELLQQNEPASQHTPLDWSVPTTAEPTSEMDLLFEMEEDEENSLTTSVEGTLATPNTMVKHLEAEEASLAKQREGLREQNLKALKTPRPISETIPGGSHSASMAQMLIKQQLHTQDPLMEDKLYDDISKARGHSIASVPQHDTVRLVQWVYDTVSKVQAEIVVHVVEARVGAVQNALDGLSTLAKTLLKGEPSLFSTEGVHEWHAHCMKLFLKNRVDSVAASMVDEYKFGDESQRRFRRSVVTHDATKLEKLTSAMGKRFFNDFWMAAQRGTAHNTYLRLFYETLKARQDAAETPQISLTLSLRESTHLRRIFDAFTEAITTATRALRDAEATNNLTTLEDVVDTAFTRLLRLKEKHSTAGEVPLGTAQSLCTALETYGQGSLAFSYSACLARYAEINGDAKSLEDAASMRTDALHNIKTGQSATLSHGLRLINPLRHEHYVLPSGGDDGSGLLSTGDITTAETFFKSKHSGLTHDKRDYIAFLLRNFEFRRADEATVMMMRTLDKAKGAVIKEWPSHSMVHRAALWHRYMHYLNCHLHRLWTPYHTYPRAALLLQHTARSAEHHYTQGIEQLHLSGATSGITLMTSLHAHETFRLLYEHPNTSPATFLPPLRTSEELQISLKSLQENALQLLEESDDGCLDDDSWVGQGSGVRWYIIVLADYCERGIIEDALCTNGSTGDSTLWQSYYTRLQSIVHDAAEGAEQAYLKGRMALLMHRRPYNTTEESAAFLAEATEMAVEYVQWMVLRADKRFWLEQRSLWLHVYALAAWGTISAGRTPEEWIEDTNLDSMRYEDAGSVRRFEVWVDEMERSKVDIKEKAKETSVLYGSAKVYLR